MVVGQLQVVRQLLTKPSILVLGCQLDNQAVHLVRQVELAAEAGVGLDEEGLIEHILLVLRHIVEFVVADDVAMAGGTQRHAATSALDGQLVSFAQLHDIHIHIGGCLQLVGCVVPIYDGNLDHVGVYLPASSLSLASNSSSSPDV